MNGEQGEDLLQSAKPSGKFVVNGIELDREDTRRAKVLYDYEATDEKELTVYCDQVKCLTCGDGVCMLDDLSGASKLSLSLSFSCTHIHRRSR